MSLAGLRFELHSPLKGGQRAALITVLFEPGAGLAIRFGGRLIADGLLEARRRLALLGQLRREPSNDGRKKKRESQRKLYGKPARSVSDLDSRHGGATLGCEWGQVNEIGLSPIHAKTPICRRRTTGEVSHSGTIRRPVTPRNG